MNSIDLLCNRQSNPHLQEPAPAEEDLDIILKAGMRVPDHGGLKPWHFTLVEHDGLRKLSDCFLAVAKQENADHAKLEKTAKMPFRAPLIIIVSTRYQQHDKVPESEQLIAAGCCVHAMQMAAFALGYGAVWRTGAFSHNDFVKNQLCIPSQDSIVGFLYIGTPSKQRPLKKASDYSGHVTYL